MKLKIEILKAIANPLRLKILECLCDGEKNVTQIISICQESQSNISKALSILKNNKIISDEKRGNQVFYKIEICCLDHFLLALEQLTQESMQKQIEDLENTLKRRSPLNP